MKIQDRHLTVDHPLKKNIDINFQQPSFWIDAATIGYAV